MKEFIQSIRMPKKYVKNGRNNYLEKFQKLLSTIPNGIKIQLKKNLLELKLNLNVVG